MATTELRFKLVPELDVEKVSAMVSTLKSTLGSVGIKLDDQATKGLDGLKKKVSDLPGPIKSVNDEAAKTGGIFDNIAKKAFAFNQVKESVTNIAGALSDFGGGFVALDTATAKIRTLGADATKLAPEIREAAIAMSKDLPFSAADIAGAMGDAMASGVKGGTKELSAFADTAAKLAVGGDAQIGEVVKGLGGNLNAFSKSAEDAGKFADIMFNTVNAGVTTIPELNQYLSQVTPTAAAAGLSFENVGAGMALMTQKGVPTAQAATKLNALMLELVKPGKDLQAAFTGAGLSTEQLGKVMKEEGLPAALDLVQKAFDKTGKTATQMFSSSEAGSAFNVLQGQAGQFAEFLDDVANTSGSTQYAYEQMADTVEVRQKQVNAQIEAFKTSALSAFPGASAYAITFAQTLGSIAPQMASLGALAPMLKGVAGGFVNLGSSLLTKFVPQLIATSATGSISFTSLGTAGTTAFGAITAAIAANPIGAILVAVTALAVGVAAAYAIMSKSTKEQAEDQLNQAEASKKSIELEIKNNGERKKTLSTTQALTTEYKTLAAKTNLTATEQARLRTITKELDKQYPSLIDQTKSFSDNLGGVSQISQQVNVDLKKVADRGTELQKQLADNTKAIATAKRNIAIGELQDTLGTVSWKFAITGGIADGEAQRFRIQFQNLRAEFEKGLYTSKSVADVDTAESKFLEFINKRVQALGDTEAELKIREAISKAVESQKQALQAYGVVSKENTAKVDEAGKKEEKKAETAKKTTAAHKGSNDALKEGLSLLESQRRTADDNYKTEIERNATLEERSKTSKEDLQIEQSKEESLKRQRSILQDSLKQGVLKISSELIPLDEAAKTRLTKNIADIQKEIKQIDIKAKPEEVATLQAKLKKYQEDLNKGTTGGNLLVALKTVEDRESVQDSIDKITEQLAATANPQSLITAKIDVEAIKEQRRQLEARIAELKTDITARVVPVLPARKELLELITKQIGDVQARIKATTDPGTAAQLKQQLKELVKEFEENTTIQIRDEYIGGASTAAEATYRKVTVEAQAAFSARVATQSRTLDEELTDFNDYLAKKTAAEADYATKSRSASLQGLYDLSQGLAGNIQKLFNDAFAQTDEQTKSSDERKDSINDEISAVQKSYDRMLINQATYYDKMRELDDKRNEEVAASANEQKTVWEVMLNSLEQSFSDLKNKSLSDLSAAGNDYNKLLAAQSDFYKQQQTAEARLAKLTDTTSAEYIQATKDKQSATEGLKQSVAASGDAMNKVWEGTALAVGASLGQMLSQGKVTLGGMIAAVLDSLQALVPVLSAQLLAVMISSPNPINVATLGAGGLAAYAGLNALMIGAIQGAKALALGSFHTGGYTGAGSKYDVRGIVHADEFVMDKELTGSNRRHYEIMHKERLSVEDYSRKYLQRNQVIHTAYNYSKQMIESGSIEAKIAQQTEVLQAELRANKKVMEKVVSRFTSHTTHQHEVKVKIESRDNYVY